MKLRTATLGLTAFALIACDGTNGRRSADAAESSRTATTPRAGDRDMELDRNRAMPRVITTEISRTEINPQTDGRTQQQRTEQRGTEQNTRFGIRDTVFLAVTTENPAADSRISVRVRSEDGTVVDSTGKAVDRMGYTGTGERMGNTAARTGTQMGTMGQTGQTGQTGTQNTGARMSTSDQMGTDNSVTQFHLVQNNGWTAGDYTVDIWLNDRHVETKMFSVQR